jgi:hypothetical protein
VSDGAVHEDAQPLRGQLEAVAARYHRAQDEHLHASTRGGARRLLEEQLFDARREFERLLDGEVADADLRREWGRHLHYRTPPPAAPS